jgi:hypothetical protein
MPTKYPDPIDPGDIALITPKVAAEVLHVFGYTGHRASGFKERLLATIQAADSGNAYRLALGFPDYVAAVRLMYEVKDAPVLLAGIAGITLTADEWGDMTRTVGAP